MFTGDLLTERARVTPDRLALVDIATGQRLTYAQLDARAGVAAATLHAIGLEAGDRLGLLAFNSLEFLELFFGALKAGVIVVPLSTRATAHELTHIVSDCGMKALFAGEEFAALELNVPRYALNHRLAQPLSTQDSALSTEHPGVRHAAGVPYG
jgi:fatty-acyl-CoA synthase